jgi:hypothetical protein
MVVDISEANRMNLLRPAGCIVTLVSTLHTLSLAQVERQLKLAVPNASLPKEFSRIASVRELADGRVLITDAGERRVLVADFRTGAVRQLGRGGVGPGEYGMVGILFPLGADSSLMPDPVGRRWLLFSGPSIVATPPLNTPSISGMNGVASGADSLGNVFRWVLPDEFDQEMTKAGIKAFGVTDSGYVLRVNRASGKLDTVTKLRSSIYRRKVEANTAGQFPGVSFSIPPLSVGEQATLFLDGWFAVARLDPFRIDWIAPDGRASYGRPILVPRIKITSAEKDAYFERLEHASAVSNMPPLPQALIREQRAMSDQFPDMFPPFTTGLIAGGDGNVWLRRPVSMHFSNARYDIVNRQGQLLGVVSLAKGEWIVAVSKYAVYVAWRGTEGVELLRRHALPY